MALINPSWLTNPANMLATEHGIPSCLLDFGEDVLKFLGNGTLNMMSKQLMDGRMQARGNISKIVGDIFKEKGIISYNSATGKFSFMSAANSMGIDFAALNAVASAVGDINEIYAAGQQVHNFGLAVEACLDEYKSFIKDGGTLGMTVGAGGMDSEHGRSQYTDNAVTAGLGLQRELIQQNLDFAGKCTDQLNVIGGILYTRQQEEVLAEVDDGPIFRLTFGPPKSKQGLFVLSEDGLYYDSQERLYNGDPLPSASDVGFVLSSEKWKLDHSPNLGGKGTLVSVAQLDQYVDTIFDISKIDNSTGMSTYYKADHFLEIISGQQDKLVNDLSKNIQELLDLGHNEDSAMVLNYKQNLYSLISTYNQKRDKRKKQIEVAVKGPDLFGSTEAFSPGLVPVNDFSFLSDIGLTVALEKQQQLTFDSGEVSGVVLPLRPKYVRNHGVQSRTVLSPIVLPPVGFGSIVINPSVNSDKAPAISLTDSISTSGLLASYNFLRGLTLDPSSTGFNVMNPALPGSEGDGQLVGVAESVFRSGLAIPYLEGIADFHAQTGQMWGKNASYFRLPSIDQFQNMLYRQEGCSIECWLQIPMFGSDLTSNEKDPDAPLNLNSPNNGAWADYNYYRIILANENTGGVPQALNVSTLATAPAAEAVKGFLMGFTRDPVITSDTPMIAGTNKDPGINGSISASSTMASSCFFIAPTMSFGADAVEFLPKIVDCSFAGYRKMKIPVSTTNSNGVSFGAVSSSFIHLHVSFDPSEDECTVYLDGRSVAVSSLSDLFGVQGQSPPRVPSFIVPQNKPYPSFYYTSSTVTYNQTEQPPFYNNGPNTDTYFTPWIVGGGWTYLKSVDLNNPAQGNNAGWTASKGGFMGDRHGYGSGLNGHVGSLKFYSRPLTTTEVLQNYEGQAGFFKSIDL